MRSPEPSRSLAGRRRAGDQLGDDRSEHRWMVVDADGLYALLTVHKGRGRRRLFVAWGSRSLDVQARPVLLDPLFDVCPPPYFSVKQLVVGVVASPSCSRALSRVRST
jgi:hypothetical protein